MPLENPTSNRLQTKASAFMPLGANSNTRYWGEQNSLYIQKAQGAYVWDVDGHQYIDYRLAFGPIILGYAYEPVTAKVYEAMRQGLTAGLTHPLEIEVAQKIVDMCPGVDMVRVVSTGTEATMHAIRLARAYTGREKIIKFEGGYHGSHDQVLFSTYAPPEVYGHLHDPISIPASSGIPRTIGDLVITLPFNQPEILENRLRSVGHQVAALVTEPMLGNFGAIEPLPGFLELIRSLCDQYGIVLLLDEVKTGFRIARGGAQEVYGIHADLVTYAKALGNGYPVAAYGGKQKIMQLIGRGVTQGGTYAGNGMSIAAADATLSILRDQPVLESIAARGHRLQSALSDIFRQNGVKATVSRHPAIFSVTLGIDRVTQARDWALSDRQLYRSFAHALRTRGVLIDDDPREPWCLCYAHTDADIDTTVESVEEALKSLL
jgi:glutamate-1-semialdehyde 2,1-aminomutase